MTRYHAQRDGLPVVTCEDCDGDGIDYEMSDSGHSAECEAKWDATGDLRCIVTPECEMPCSTCHGSGLVPLYSPMAGDYGWAMDEGPDSASAMTIAFVSGEQIWSDDPEQPPEYIGDFTLVEPFMDPTRQALAKAWEALTPFAEGEAYEDEDWEDGSPYFYCSTHPDHFRAAAAVLAQTRKQGDDR